MVHHVWQATPVMEPAKIQSSEKVVSAPREGLKKGLHACEVCGNVFTTSGDLTKHMLSHCVKHALLTFKPIGGAKERKREYNKALYEKKKAAPAFACKTCGKAFTTSSKLVVHMRKHTGEKSHVCGICDKAFAAGGSLTVHMRLHTGEKPHVCETCGKAFSTSHCLAVHMLTHTGEKPHVCETCGKRFSLPGNLAKHMRLHTGEKPHVCETCGKGFAQNGTMHAHMRTHVR
jgi:KRAB domain-containing zinc finger protein